MKKSWIILAIFLFSFSLASAVDIPDYKDKYINDYASVFSEGERLDLRNLFASVDENTTAEIVFLSVNECVLAPSDFALKVFDKWKIGKEDKDNGLLILYCLKENKIFVMTGYGLEGILPDSKIGRILDENYVPLRDENKTKEGIISASQVFAQVIIENREEILSGQAGPKINFNFSLLIFPIVLFFIFLGVGLFFKRKKKKTALHVLEVIMDIILIVFIFIIGANILLFIFILILIILLRVFLGINHGGGFGGFIPVPISGCHGGGFSGGGSGGGMSGGGGAGR